MYFSLSVLAFASGTVRAAPRLRASTHCGVASCTDQVWDSVATKDGHADTCGNRHNWLVNDDGRSEGEACQIITADFPGVCPCYDGAAEPSQDACTDVGGDMWSSGSEVPCCAGLEKTLSDDHRWVCEPGNGGNDNAVPGPAPSSRGLADLALCYGYGTASRNTIEGVVAGDMAKVASCPATSGVEKIRTYLPSYFGLKKVTEFEGLADKRLLPSFHPDATEGYMWFVDRFMEHELRAVYAADNVEAILYLNERYGDRHVRWARDFLRSMEGVRTAKPVLTSQTTQGDYARYTELLAQGFDGIMINIYPGRTFTSRGGADPEGDFHSFCHQLNEIHDYYAGHHGPGENFYGVSETGMPADPFGAGASRAYFDNIKAFMAGERDCPQFSYDRLVARNGGPESWTGIYSFAATSEPNKGSALENSFGITDAFCPHEERATSRAWRR